MSGFPDFEPDDHVQLIIVHMDNSESYMALEANQGWRVDADHGLVVDRHGGRTTFPWHNVKSHTIVFADESLAEIRHLDPDHTNPEDDGADPQPKPPIGL